MQNLRKLIIISVCRLPQNYLFQEKPQLARWDKEAKVWRTGGFQEVLCDLGRHCMPYSNSYLKLWQPILVICCRGQYSDVSDISLRTFSSDGGRFQKLQHVCTYIMCLCVCVCVWVCVCVCVYKHYVLFQDRYVNMPYQSWEMLPLGPNHTKLTITGGIVEITVEVKVWIISVDGNGSHPYILANFSGIRISCCVWSILHGRKLMWMSANLLLC